MTLRVDYGLVTLQAHPDDPPDFGALYDDALHQAERAEQCGFDGLWVSEHHLSADGYLPSPFPFLAAVAARTSSIELGTNIAVAPLYHPRRIAEDAAVIAAIGRRRVIVGLGIGYRAREFAAFDVARSGRAAHIERCADFCRSAWAAPVTDPEFGGLPVTAIAPEVWLGGLAPAALTRAGRLGDGFVATSASVGALRDKLAVVDAAAEAASRDVKPGVVTNHLISLRRDGRMRLGVERGITQMMRVYAQYAAEESDAVIADHLARRPAQDGRELAIWGGPDEVVEGLAQYVAAFAGEREHRLMVRLHFPGMLGEEAGEHIELFASTVAPRLRSLAAGQAAAGRESLVPPRCHGG